MPRNIGSRVRKPTPKNDDQPTFTLPPTPPDLKDFLQLDHPYTDVGGRCFFCVCPEEEHTDDYEVDSRVEWFPGEIQTAFLLTRQRQSNPGFGYRWLVLQLFEGQAHIVLETMNEEIARGKVDDYVAGIEWGLGHAQHARP